MTTRREERVWDSQHGSKKAYGSAEAGSRAIQEMAVENGDPELVDRLTVYRCFLSGDRKHLDLLEIWNALNRGNGVQELGGGSEHWHVGKRHDRIDPDGTVHRGQGREWGCRNDKSLCTCGAQKIKIK